MSPMAAAARVAVMQTIYEVSRGRKWVNVS